MISLLAAAIAASSPGAQSAPAANMHAGHSQQQQQQQHGAQPQQGHQQHGQGSGMGDCHCCKEMMGKMHSAQPAGAKPAQQGHNGH